MDGESINKALLADTMFKKMAAGGALSGQQIMAQCDAWTTSGQLTQVREPSIADSIEDRISCMQRDVDRLKGIKKQLSEPNGVLSMSMDDLYFLMRY